MFFGGSGVSARPAENRPVTLGVALAFPVSVNFNVPRAATEGLQFDILVPIEFYVSAQGKVLDVKGTLADDTTILRLIDSSLRNLVFEPGQIDSINCNQLIPAEILLRPNSTSAGVRTPINDSGRIENQDLYLAGLAANGVTPPSLLHLAPVFLAHPGKDTLKELPYALIRIDLDAQGRQQQVKSIRSTLAGFTSELESAFNWAQFAPAKKEKRELEATIYAVVVYHPHVRYPTLPVTPVLRDSLSNVESRLIRLVTNFDGVMIPPLPRSGNGDSISISRSKVKSFGLISLWCHIDTSAQVWFKRVSSSGREASLACREVLSELKFLPAIDFEGRRVEFDGLIYLDFVGSGNIRIYADWLRKPGSPPVR